MRFLFPLILFSFASCTMPEVKDPVPVPRADSSPLARLGDTDTNEALEPLPPIKKAPQVKSPSGYYSGSMPVGNGNSFQTVQFLSDRSYILQQIYKGDSIVKNRGSWAPSDGFIWLYQDGVVVGRYHWKDNMLNYFDPETRKSFPLQPVETVLSQAAWKSRSGSSTQLFAIGTEPFWSVELIRPDSIVMNDVNLSEPLRFKQETTEKRGDTLFIRGRTDSSIVQLMVLDQFCSDGMSDFVYPKKIEVNTGTRKLKGCAVIYQ